MDYLRVKNWQEFQHYKDRSPPWIKLHRTLLDDYEFAALPDESKGHLLLIWLMASQLGGRVPADPKFIAAKISSKKPPDLALLIAHGFLIPEQVASNPLAESKQVASTVLALARSQEERTRTTEGEENALATPTPAHKALAAQLGVACAYEWEKFCDHQWPKGKEPKDKSRGFRNWLRRAHDFAERDGRLLVADQPRQVAL